MTTQKPNSNLSIHRDNYTEICTMSHFKSVVGEPAKTTVDPLFLNLLTKNISSPLFVTHGSNPISSYQPSYRSQSNQALYVPRSLSAPVKRARDVVQLLDNVDTELEQEIALLKESIREVRCGMRELKKATSSTKRKD